MSSPDPAKRPARPPRKGRLRWIWRIGVPLVLLAAALVFLRREGEVAERGTTFVARRGPLKITVLEGGSVEALESQEIKSEVRGETKILSIVEEGYMVTPEDVENSKILVELDATELEENQISQELDYQNSLANFTEAREAFEIQINQNRSDITSAELEAKFAGMDFQKYMGAAVAGEILALVPEPEAPSEAAVGPAAETTDEPGGGSGGDGEAQGEGAVEDGADEEPQDDALETEIALSMPEPEARLEVDFTPYADPGRLGDGEAGQKLRKLEDDLVLAEQELVLAKTQLEGTERLAAREFVTKNELENEQLKVRRNEISLASARTSRELFIRYEFPKEAEKLLSGHVEALMKLERANKLAVSKLAQARAKLKSAEARHRLQTKKREEIQEQLEKCIIRAERSGLVVYGGGENRYWRQEEQIEEGAKVRERQQIITIPDMTEMAVKVKVHESAIKNVKKEQKARVTVDAYPDRELTGKVIKVGVLPDSQNRWMNPDVKVYETSVSIDKVHEWLKPGMSAEVEILVKELSDVVYVPIQAVVPSNGDRVVYLAGLGQPERRVVETGEYNNEFIEIKGGLKEGEEVLLRAPLAPEEADTEGEGGKPERKRPKEGEARPKGPRAGRSKTQGAT